MQVIDYTSRHQSSLIEAYIATFAQPPWNEHWQAPWVAQRLQWLHNMPTFMSLVILENNQVVAALLGFSIPFKGKLDFEISELLVLPTRQKQGLAKLLIAQCRAKLAAQGDAAGVMQLLTAKGSQAEQFYLHLGFSERPQLGFMTQSIPTPSIPTPC